MASLGVNIDHIANVRQARLTNEPDPIQLAFLAELGGADGITVHLREDRRHIQDRDVKILRETIKTRLNLEMAPTEEMLDIATQIKPDMITLVPEKREEITTEGGLNVLENTETLEMIISRMKALNISTSLFIDPDSNQIEASSKLGANYIELHTGSYATATCKGQSIELKKIIESVTRARNLGLHVNAGHGLTYNNVENIAAIQGMEELNIGHTIISRALAIGLKEAVREMKMLIMSPRKEPIFGS